MFFPWLGLMMRLSSSHCQRQYGCDGNSDEEGDVGSALRDEIVQKRMNAWAQRGRKVYKAKRCGASEWVSRLANGPVPKASISTQVTVGAKLLELLDLDFFTLFYVYCSTYTDDSAFSLHWFRKSRFPEQRRPSTVGWNCMKSTRRVLGHSLLQSLTRSLREGGFCLWIERVDFI